LQNLNWNAVANLLTKEPNGIDSLTEFTGAKPLGASSSNSIALDGNSTSFGDTAFKNVPVVLYQLNSNIISLTLSRQETNRQCVIPLYSIITSMTLIMINYNLIRSNVLSKTHL
jgi:hypothetical protein